MEKKFILAFLAALAVVSFSYSFAESVSDISYPVEELGNCSSEEECISYCDDLSHEVECTEFAKKHNLDYSVYEGEVSFPVEALGNCSSETECRQYCEVVENLESCLNFAEENNLLSREKIEEARKVLPFLLSGNTPGNCKTEQECHAYCEEESNFSECVDFAVKAGFISAEEAEIAKKVGPSGGPGGCKGEEECMNYCATPDHAEECVEFGVRMGFIDPSEAETVKQLMAKGITSGPGNCKGREECDLYCATPEHAEECVEFGVMAGFIDPEEAEMAKQMLSRGITSGPGGCKEKEECDTYCEAEEHIEECIEFARMAGFISDEEYENLKKFGFRQGPESGPGGCMSEEECTAFCSNPENLETCNQWNREHGYEEMGSSGEGIPQPCFEQGLGEQECISYCESNPSACGWDDYQEPEYHPEQPPVYEEPSGEIREETTGEISDQGTTEEIHEETISEPAPEPEPIPEPSPEPEVHEEPAPAPEPAPEPEPTT